MFIFLLKLGAYARSRVLNVTSFILQISSQLLLVLQRLEKGLEVPFAKAAGTFAFDHFKEDRRSIDNRLGEDLQQVALIVVIDKDPQFRQLLDILGNHA